MHYQESAHLQDTSAEKLQWIEGTLYMYTYYTISAGTYVAS